MSRQDLENRYLSKFETERNKEKQFKLDLATRTNASIACYTVCSSYPKHARLTWENQRPILTVKWDAIGSPDVLKITQITVDGEKARVDMHVETEPMKFDSAWRRRLWPSEKNQMYFTSMAGALPNKEEE